jgi:ATP citrate (pro-S)-lyase
MNVTDFPLSYLEINPLVVIPNEDKTSAEVHFLDLAAKLDQTAEFECGAKWAIARSATALGIPVAPSKETKTTIDVGPPMARRRLTSPRWTLRLVRPSSSPS